MSKNYRFTTHNLPLTTWVGFDRVFEELDRFVDIAPTIPNYPPHNLRVLSSTEYVVEMALAGFDKSEISVSTEENHLVISGEAKQQDSSSYIHKGVAARTFRKSFTLSDDVIVKGAVMKNGMLSVFLTRIVPDAKKLRQIQIEDDLVTITQELLTE
jgi:molecular chaperone IbpA